MDQGRKTLLKTFWGSGGWCYNHPAQEAYDRALAEGYFLPVRDPLPHDEAISALRCLLDQICAQDVADAFLYSLSTRKLEYRSALGSYWFARAIPAHSHDQDHSCRQCGWTNHVSLIDTDRLPAYTDDNIMNFERHKWGGVRHTHLNYILLDLTAFLKLPKAAPTQQDRDILNAILSATAELPPTKKAGAFRDLLSKKKLFPCNRDEISTMLDILGICGVLSSEAHPCPFVAFHGADGLPPQEHTNDFAYPVNYWRASDGINKARFLDVFGFDYRDLQIRQAVERIRRMEQLFDALRTCPEPAGLRALVEYYEGGQWLWDYALDEQGLLPPDLKRGVLSQDAVYNFLEEKSWK